MNVRYRLLQLLPFWLNSVYELGTNDCLQMIISLYPELPETFYNINVKNGEYKDLYKEDKELALRLYREYITSNFEEVDEYKEGDIVEIPLLQPNLANGDVLDGDMYNYTYGIVLSGDRAIFADEKTCKFKTVPITILTDKIFYRFIEVN